MNSCFFNGSQNFDMHGSTKQHSFLFFPPSKNHKKLFKEVLMKYICHLLRWMAGGQLSITGNGRIKLGKNSPQHLLQLAFASCVGKNATSAENCYFEGQGSFPKGAVFTSEVALSFW